ncbi:MAG: hypothetical protein Q7S69_08775 [Nitrosomonadaceae bacterium]|nr:hypothetical protein [Nitrosomonadaceae bacterium]
MIKSSKLKGLQCIRTMSGLVTELSHPHRKFLKLAMLTMEQARRGKEKTSAQNRIETIDARLAEIQTESKDLLQVCNTIEINKRSDAPASQKMASSARQVKGEFRLKY